MNYSKLKIKLRLGEFILKHLNICICIYVFKHTK